MRSNGSARSNSSSQSNTTASVAMKHTTDEILRSPKGSFLEQFLPPPKKKAFCRSMDGCRALLQKRGVHSFIAMSSAGFYYTGDGDTACCADC